MAINAVSHFFLNIIPMKHLFWACIFFPFIAGCNSPGSVQEEDTVVFQIDTRIRRQVIHNFGASDSWSCQFVGRNWPLEKRERIADLLFSMETDGEGNPKGIGLSLWRFNIGAGSAEQGASGDIGDEWRRAECFLNEDGSYNWEKQEGQRWFLEAAKQRGVEQFVAFAISPPVHFTKNGKAYSQTGNTANLEDDRFDDYAGFLADVLQHFETNGLAFDYISPVNEPQWNWDAPSQEGSPYLNSEILRLAKELDKALTDRGLSAKTELPEAARLIDLYQDDLLPERDNQLAEFFDPAGAHYLGDLPTVAKKATAHSYFTTYPDHQLRETRRELKEKMAAVDPALEFWMSEYCILEDNALIKGNGRDLLMDPAIYMAKVIHYDLTLANASAWHWWLAVSPYDYKDGLVYIDYDKFDGAVYESKMLWAMGNFSRFIRPGMHRVEALESSTGSSVLVSAYHGQGRLTTILINPSYDEKVLELSFNDNSVMDFDMYTTSGNADDNLSYKGKLSVTDPVRLPPRSVTTLTAGVE